LLWLVATVAEGKKLVEQRPAGNGVKAGSRTHTDNHALDRKRPDPARCCPVKEIR